MDSLRKGLYDIVSPEILGIFNIWEFELILTGNQDIDVEDWKRNSYYLGQYNENHKVERIVMIGD